MKPEELKESHYYHLKEYWEGILQEDLLFEFKGCDYDENKKKYLCDDIHFYYEIHNSIEKSVNWDYKLVYYENTAIGDDSFRIEVKELGPKENFPEFKL